MAKAQKSTAIVVYKEKPSQSQPRRKNRNKNRKNKSRSDGDAIAAFRAALANPFSITAQGARIPDMFSCPTVTKHVTRVITVSADSNGEADVTVLPNLYQLAISSRASLVGESTWITGDAVSYTNSTVLMSGTTLAAQLTNYRIVGYGVKVIGLQNDAAAAGRLHIATLPVSSWVNSQNTPVGGQVSNRNDPNQTLGSSYQALGVQVSGTPNKVAISGIPALPNSIEVPVNKLNDSPVTIVPKVTSPEAFAFRMASDSPNGFASVDQTSTSWVTSGDSSYLRIAGHEAVLLAMSGLTPSTPVVDVEVIYHIEGAPMVGLTNTIVSPDTSQTLVNPSALANVIQQVARMPAFRAAVETGGNMIFPGLGTLANRFY